MADAVKAPVFGTDGTRTGEMDLPERFFNAPVNQAVMHAAVRAQLAAARAGTHSTKTRGEVRGGGVKPWRQKGSGRARHGSIREPQWTGGGVAHGPKPRDYSMRINKKEKALALRSALTVRAQEGAVRVVELPELDAPETKRAVRMLEQWEASGKVLIVLGGDNPSDEVYKSFRNLPNVMSVSTPTPYHVLAADTVVIARSALDSMAGSESDGAKADTQKEGGE